MVKDFFKILFSKKDRNFRAFLKDRLHIRTWNIGLYRLAFLHKSASIDFDPENKSKTAIINNERLEFLGDAVLDAIAADFLYMQYPTEREGILTQFRSNLVNRKQMDRLANKLGLLDALIANVGKSVNPKVRISGEILEALIGALYLDKGYEHTKRYVIKLFQKMHHTQGMQIDTNYKSLCLEWGQHYKIPIDFVLIEEYKDTQRRGKMLFKSGILIGNVRLGCGTAYSKKRAEQLASKQAYAKLETLSPPDTEEDFLAQIEHAKIALDDNTWNKRQTPQTEETDE